MKTIISMSSGTKNVEELGEQLELAKKVFAKAVNLAKDSDAPKAQLKKTLGNALSDMRAYLDFTLKS